MLVYRDATSGAAPCWYRVQPVVRGNPAWFDTGLSTWAGVPAVRLDQDGDGSLESVDVGIDGFIEFIDPALRGLGLAYASEIASSPLAGLGPDPAMASLDCSGNIVSSQEIDCGNGADDDGDTLVDCADSDCANDEREHNQL